MQKTIITVPAGIRYISQWEEFKLSNFPARCIINKIMPGCGFTRYCIESRWENVILCSPRKMLLQNKHDQHPLETYLVVNERDTEIEVDGDLEKDSKTPSGKRKVPETFKKELDEIPDDPMKNNLTDIKSRLHRELREYMGSHVQWKILVTYDSFRVLKEVLEDIGVFDRFFVVIDEFQALMQDSRFKSSTEINFLYHLQGSHSSLFVSATPMLEEYLDELPEFKDLPYYELDWRSEDLSRTVKPNLEVKSMTGKSVGSIAKKIITEFKSGKIDSVQVARNNSLVTVYAKELVFYLNSVSAITNIIKICDLQDSEVNILCSNTEKNQEKIWDRLGIKGKDSFLIGRVPIRNEPRKPITFCTRTVYLGADFYSDCAKSYIFSDASSEYLSVDISQDLPQILGRQRCDENPWKNSATLFYRVYKGKNGGSIDFNKKLEKKVRETENLLTVYESAPEETRQTLVEKFLLLIHFMHYSDDYVAVNKETIIDPVTGKRQYKLVPVRNHLVRVSEKRAFDIQNIEYANRFSIFSALSNEFDSYSELSGENNPIELQVTEFFRSYEALGRVSDRLKLLCEVPMTQEALIVVLNQLPDTDRVKTYFKLLGPARSKACNYEPGKMDKELGIKFFSKKSLADKIYDSFPIGSRITLKSIKETLSGIYKNENYQKTPKAIDLIEYFEVKKILIYDRATGKSSKGYELIRKLL